MTATIYPSGFGGIRVIHELGAIHELGEIYTDHEIEVRLGNSRPAHAVYVRRRLAAGLVILGLCVAIGVTARSALADRGGVPASTPAVRSAIVPAVTPPVTPAASQQSALDATSPAHQYIVQRGDTLWSLASLFHGHVGVGDYVDALVSTNGGSVLQVGQLLTLP